MPTRGPLNGRSEGPTHGATETARRLREKMSLLRGKADRRRAEAKAALLLSHGQAGA